MSILFGTTIIFSLSIFLLTNISFIGFDNVVETKGWSDNDIMLLRTSSEILGNALERREVEFVISYDKIAPPRKEVIAKLAADMNAKNDLVVVEKMRTEFGTHSMVGRAKIYGNAENLKAVEYDYIFERGKTGEGKAKKTDAKKAAGKEAEAGQEKGADKKDKAQQEKGAGKEAEKSGDGETQTSDAGGDETKAE